jgi:hypothetical protein
VTLWEFVGYAVVGWLLLNALLVYLLFRPSKRAEEATQFPRSDFSDYLAETESRVSRMHFRRTTRWHKEVA